MKLDRKITTSSLVAFYFSTVVGVGAFVVPGKAAELAGPASIISWILMLLFTYPIALIHAEISKRYKVSDAVLRFLNEAIGLNFAKSIALFMMVSAMFGNLILAYTASGYCINLFDIEENPFNSFIIALLILKCSCIFNMMRIGTSSKIQSITLMAIIGIILIVVACAIPHYNLANADVFMPNGVSGIVNAVIICSYAVTGWENVDAIAEEVENPAKTYKRAIKYSLLLISAFYLLLAITAVFILDAKALRSNTPLIPAILHIIAGPAAAKFSSLLVIAVLMLGCNAWILGTSRIIFGLARDEVLPSRLCYIHPATKIPTMALLSQFICYLLLGLIFLKHDHSMLLIVTALNYLILYAIVFLCGVKVFESFKMKSLSSISFIVITALLIVDTSNEIYNSIAILLLCFLYVLLIWRRKKDVQC